MEAPLRSGRRRARRAAALGLALLAFGRLGAEGARDPAGLSVLAHAPSGPAAGGGGSARPLSLSNAVREEGDGWIALQGDYCAILPHRPEILWSVLTNYGAYPGVFHRIAEARVQRVGPRAVLLSQRTVFRFFGLSFENRSTLAVEEAFEAREGRGRIGFRSVEDDGSVRNIEGGWYLEAREEGRACYVRYRLSSLSRKAYPFQGELISIFLDEDFSRLFAELSAGAERAEQAGN